MPCPLCPSLFYGVNGIFQTSKLYKKRLSNHFKLKEVKEDKYFITTHFIIMHTNTRVEVIYMCM